MARQTGTQERQEPPLTRNPRAGAVLTVAAGGQAEAEWDFVNDSPDVAGFYLQVSGLPDPDWVTGVGEPCATWAAASGGGCVRLTLAPPRDAAGGDYPFQVAVVSGGASVGTGPVSLILRVTPAPELAAPVDEAPVADGAATQPPRKTPRPRATRAKAKPDAAPEAPVAAAVAGLPENVALRPGPVPVPPEDDPLPVVDFSRSTPTEAEEEHDVEETVPSEPSLLDPKDGAIIALCPGETRLVRFGFVNDSAQERTYILDEDRSLETGWITLVQDQVNLTRNGRGEVSVRLTPPKDAEPGDYPFMVTAGLQGGTLTPVSLVLSVLATPAVRLTAAAAAVSVGPFGAAVDFPLVVETAGNADTAFRIAVKSPDGRAAAATEAPGPDNVYETPQWRYLFDRELDTLRSPASGRAPLPVTIRLRLQRRGIWWLGFRESHRVHVAAVPVTDPANGGKSGNAVDLTAVRWRLLPFPLLLLLPVVLVLALFLSGSARTLDVPNASQDEAGQYWVVDPPGDKKDLTLKWQAPGLALLRLTGQNGDQTLFRRAQVGGGTYHEQVTVSSEERKVTHVYRISRLVGGGDRDAVVSFVFTRSDTPLLVLDAGAHRPLTGAEVSLAVPSTGFARLDLKNLSPQSTRIDWWLTKSLHDDAPFQFLYVKNSGSIEQGGAEHLLIRRSPTALPGAADRIVFVTTDANRPVVTVNLTSGL